jgi:hypothetical protein
MAIKTIKNIQNSLIWAKQQHAQPGYLEIQM